MGKKEFSLSIIFVGLIILLNFYKPFQLTLVSGASMYPTLEPNQFLIMKKVDKIKRDDVVTFNAKLAWRESNKRDFIKRVVGIPGDKIYVDENQLFVNGEPYITFDNLIENNIGSFAFQLKKDEYFLVGDNIGRSHDSLYRLLSNYPNYTVNKKYIKYYTEVEREVEWIYYGNQK